MSEQSATPNYVRVYGGNHSPWVQAVLLGLYEKQIAHDITSVPPLDSFLESGVMMPTASIDGRPWQRESAEILEALGYEAVSDEDMGAIRGAWQGVMYRAEYWPRFWGEFSLSGDRSATLIRRLVNNFLRSFVTLYFFLLIRSFVNLGKRKDPENYGDQYLAWEEKLASSGGPFLGGETPNSLDLLLFGVIQCHCSNYVPPVAALQSDPRLGRVRKWIGDMQERFRGYDYPGLYSGIYFAPHSPPPTPATKVERAAFWLGTIFMVSFFWITIPLVFFLALRNRKFRGQAISRYR